MNLYDLSQEVFNRLPSDYKGSITHDLSLRYIDNVIEYLFNVLKQEDLLEDTCIIITADHGFSFSGNPLRDSFLTNLYLENYNVPLLIYNSGYEPRIINDRKTTKEIPARSFRQRGRGVGLKFAAVSFTAGKGAVSPTSGSAGISPPQQPMMSATVTALGIKCRAIRLAGVV